MPIKEKRPITPGQRHKSTFVYPELTKKSPEKKLTLPLRKTGGRNQSGKITSRHRGGGHKQLIRQIDLKQI